MLVACLLWKREKLSIVSGGSASGEAAFASCGAIQITAAQPFESQPWLAMDGWGRSRVQGGWGGEGRGGRRSPRNVVRPRDGERMADIGNEPNTKLYDDEHSSNSPPWVVNVSKVI